MIGISIRSNIKEFTAGLNDWARKQVPFATAQTLTALAADVQVAERVEMADKLDRPTPFTLNSVRIRRATKANLTAQVFVMDIAASYLEPFVTGGKHKLIGKGKTWLNPKGIPLNQYGNLSKSQLATLRARPDVFVGTVVTKTGERIGGVWQRPTPVGRRASGRGRLKANRSGHMRLLVRFGDAIDVNPKNHLDWEGVGKATVARNLHRRWGEAMGRALATARR